ncbi:MAG: hypothetical protein JJU42_07130 [Rhodobacteraceae bacterium]|nr:hypothetical protein [Paracoccaceae bacterium]
MALATLSGCGQLGQHVFADPRADVDIPQGPPVQEIVTVFDEALECVNGMIGGEVAFAVGNIQDSTGRVDGNAGTMVSQGAGDMIQSALFRAGVTVINRRDANIAVTEANWGIRDIRRQTPVDFFISGSINSLDFIPGGSASLTVAGVGPRARQNRVLIGLDLAISDAFSGRLIGNVSLQKQIYSREFGLSVGRFFDDVLVTGDAGYIEREALHFTLRQMLNLGTLMLLGHVIREDSFQTCRAEIEPFAGGVRLNRQSATAQRAASSPALAVEVPSVTARAEDEAAAQLAAAAPETAATPPATAPTRPEYEVLGEEARRLAARAITAARDSEGAETRNEAARLAAQSMQLANAALQRLQAAAQAGLDGDEGDVAAVVVQQAVTRSRAAAVAAADRPPDVPRQEPAQNPSPDDDYTMPDVSSGETRSPDRHTGIQEFRR